MTQDFIDTLSFLIPALAFFAVLCFWYFRFQKMEDLAQAKRTSRLQAIKLGKVISEDTASSLLQSEKGGIEKSLERLFQSKLIRVNDLGHWLKRTGYDISPALFLLSAVGVLCSSLVLMVMVYDIQFVYAVLAALALSSSLPFLIAIYLINKQKSNFLAIFPTALDMIRRALRAGHTPNRAMSMVAVEVDPPVGPVFRLIVDRMSLGESLEDALAEASSRLDIDDFHFLAVVMILQKETGGSLSEAIENLATLLRERQKLRMKIKALSAEGKAGAVILIGLPIILFLIIQTINPGFMSPLLESSTGHNLLLMGAGLMMAGIFTITRMIKIDVT